MRSCPEYSDRTNRTVMISAAIVAAIGLAVCREDPQKFTKLDKSSEIYLGIAEIRKQTWGASPDPDRFWLIDGKLFYENASQPAFFNGHALKVDHYGQTCKKYACDQGEVRRCIIEQISMAECK